MAKRVYIIFIVWVSLLFPGSAWGTLYYYSGTMDSRFVMTHTYTILVPGSPTSLTFKAPLPENYSLPNSTQRFTGLNYSYSGTPSVEDVTDTYDNHYKKFIWTNPTNIIIIVTISYTVSSSTDWNKFVTSDKYPFDSSGLPDSVTKFLQPSKEVQSDNPQFINLAKTLTSGLTTQWQVLTALNGWIMDNIYYYDNPPGYDALTTLTYRLGNCSNFAHIALALVRAAGIPARFVGGYSISKTYTLPTTNGHSIDASWGEGSHAWIEVYYPSLGWVPYDPQRDVHHVDTHRVLLSRGADTTGITGETSATYDVAQSSYPYTYQTVNVNWLNDSIALSYIKSTNEISNFSLSSAVTFIQTHTITASASSGGSISLTGKVNVTDGSDQTFTVTPDSGYYIADVLVDWASQGPVSTYTFNNVTADHTITARFLLTDSDGDGLPDWWEQQIIDYSQSDTITGFEDVLPEDDFDGDHFSNLKEYQKGTDPTDPGSHPPRAMPWLDLLLGE